MKIIVKTLCYILAVFCIWFPFAYFHSSLDKKEIKSSHILVETEQEAIDIKKQIDEGKSFEEMVEKYSLCPSKEDKGDLGYKSRKMLFPEFEKVQYKLKLNEVSDPVKTSAGWHLIKNYDLKYYSDKESFSKIHSYNEFLVRFLN
ncbi:MAG: peptidylprolyl isomerase [Candidatus Gastranaerophilales bacterium]|nr:peptidylprolyl isomerase [Candidatus Gastranaerophilales bacterium]